MATGFKWVSGNPSIAQELAEASHTGQEKLQYDAWKAEGKIPPLHKASETTVRHPDRSRPAQRIYALERLVLGLFTRPRDSV